MSDAEAARVRRLLLEAARLCGADERVWRHFVEGLPEPVRRGLLEAWHWQAHGGQRQPEGEWTVWLLMAGRGFGKTRAGAEWVHAMARAHAGALIALVGGNRDDAVKVMVEGPSGLIATARTGEPVRWRPTRGVVEFANGAEAFVYSAAAPEALRGPEHHFAWADELAKWGQDRFAGYSRRNAPRADAAWDNLMMGLRLGTRPRAVVTTTPRPTPLLKRVKALARAAVTGGTTADNPHLPDAFAAWVEETYGGTRLGRQELGGELIEEVAGSLFPRELIERCRVPPIAPPGLKRGG